MTVDFSVLVMVHDRRKVSGLGKTSAEELRDTSSAAYFWMAWAKMACVGIWKWGGKAYGTRNNG